MDDSNHVFRREGEYWTIVFGGEVIRLRDTKGLRYLAVLLRQPGRPIDAVELVTLAGQVSAADPAPIGSEISRRGPDAERARLTVTKGLKATMNRIADLHPAFAAHLHATVRRGYACVYRPDPCHPTFWQQ